MTSDSPALKAIARLKLRELERQRDALLASYEAIERHAATKKTARARLQALARGISKVRVAKEPMHPDCKNFEGVLAVGSPALVRKVLDKLEREIARGRFRSRVAFSFGALLTQWVNRSEPSDPAPELAKALLRHPSTKIDDAFWDRLTKQVNLAGIRKTAADIGRVERNGPGPATRWIANDPEKPVEMRAEAKLFIGDPDDPVSTQREKELRDAIAILWADIAGWAWAEPVALRSVWTGDRYRLHPRVDLLTTVLLSEVEIELAKLTPHLGSGRAARLARIARLRELNAPEIIFTNELKLLAETPTPLIDDPTVHGYDGHLKARTIAIVRSATARELSSNGASLAGAYGYDNVISKLAVMVGADVRVRREISPALPVYVLKTDIRDFFPSLSHELVGRILRDFGIPKAWRALALRYLAMPVSFGGGVHTMDVGMPLGMPLSRLLAEMFLALVEAHVMVSTKDLGGVHILRIVDDIVLVTGSKEAFIAGWKALQKAIAAAGLELAAEKTGAIVIGKGRLPAGMPTQPPRFGLLELSSTGELVPAEAATLPWRARLQQRMAASDTILEKVDVYNAEMRAFVQALAPSAAFGRAHYARIRSAVMAFERATGAKRRLKSEVAARYFDGGSVPDAWLHWPRSAGGLGLVDPMLELVQSRKQKDVSHPPRNRNASADEVEKTDAAWGEYYATLLEPVAAAPPKPHPLMDTLARDFVNRLSEMQGKAPAEKPGAGGEVKLAPYWRWVLATWGDDILEHFGTYRFLLKALVPLDLLKTVSD